MSLITLSYNRRTPEEERLNEKVRKTAVANNKLKLSNHLESYFLRKYKGVVEVNRMDFLHQMYSWLNRRL